jgi:type II secretory ATPase GspE/PulE/Tfp pilus assembly ATPase PilB-like protein
MTTPAPQAIQVDDAPLTAEYLEYAAVLPLALEDGRLRLATWKADVDVEVLDDLALLFCADIEIEHRPEGELRTAIQRLYGSQSTAQGVIDSVGGAGETAHEESGAIDDLVTMANEVPVVKLVNLLLVEALDARASDIHLESSPAGLAVRYRVDGVLQEAPSPPPRMSTAVVSRLKIMAELDIAERRLPQDGRIRVRLQDRLVDIRVSTVPTLHGESVVLRLLDQNRGRIGLGDLDMSAAMEASFRAAIARPHGMVLATGPTGSGKTTTLYASIDLIRTGREKILTVEDPIEYQLGVPQVPVNDKIGVTFASALRSLLRQDPDVILVGEIRDGETAEIATQAALTGHLVLSTLHTNDAPSALTRLMELQVAPYLVASTVHAVLAQRLVRTNCPECAMDVAIRPEERSASGDALGTTAVIRRGPGCAACRGTGYHGRIGIYELLTVSDALRQAVADRRPTSELRRILRDERVPTLRDDGWRRVLSGSTTPEEVLRVTAAV